MVLFWLILCQPVLGQRDGKWPNLPSATPPQLVEIAEERRSPTMDKQWPKTVGVGRALGFQFHDPEFMTSHH